MKTKETNPTRPGSPTPCKQALSGQLRESNHSGYNKIIYFLEEILLHAISSLRRVSYMSSLIVLRLLCKANIENRPCAERSLTRGKKMENNVAETPISIVAFAYDT